MPTSAAPQSAAGTLHLLLLDDHPLYGVGLAHALTTAAPGMQVLTAPSLPQGLAAAAGCPELDIVLIDYHLGAHNGIDGLRLFGEQFPQVARLLITGDPTPTLPMAARAAGASGFLGKSQSLAHMLTALRAVAAGGLAFDPAPPCQRLPMSAEAAPQPTPRQMEVLAMVGRGQPNKRIAAALGIAERTVKLHVTALLMHLGVRNRTHLLVVARERGLL